MAPLDSQRRSIVNAEVLLWQSRFRGAIALLAGLAAVALKAAGPDEAPLLGIGLVTGGYLAGVGALALRIWRRRRAQEWFVDAAILLDILFIFGITIAGSQPAYFDRVLVLAFAVVHLAESHFGRAHAYFAMLAVATGYLTLVGVSIATGAPLSWEEELWSLAVFLLAGSAFVLQYGGFRRRLDGLVGLFERAEEGDFTQAYDVDADTRPDGITLVGRAYNRVRMQLQSMVLTDPLTNCLNRRGFEQALAREAARATRAGSPFALLAIDLDHFKSVNDTYGHLAGDAVLREASALLLQTARAGDLVARTGGEEFSMILPDTDGRGGFQLATRLCETFRAHTFAVGNTGLSLTVSVGVVTTSGEIPPDRVEQLKSRADEALYQAKRSGRDRVRVWSAEHAPRGSGELRVDSVL